MIRFISRCWTLDSRSWVCVADGSNHTQDWNRTWNRSQTALHVTQSSVWRRDAYLWLSGSWFSGTGGHNSVWGDSRVLFPWSRVNTQLSEDEACTRPCSCSAEKQNSSDCVSHCNHSHWKGCVKFLGTYVKGWQTFRIKIKSLKMWYESF